MKIKEGPFHEWGDKDFDWSALNKACIYLRDRCRQFGRVGIWTKEKYGTLRVSTTCAFVTYEPIHNLIHPGWAVNRWPKWFRTYVDFPLGNLFYKLRITKLIQWYQVQVLKFFWKRAAKKWPHIAAEILDEWEITFW